MIEEIIYGILWLVIVEIIYFKVALKYDIFGMSSNVKVKGKEMKAYSFDDATSYKLVSLFCGAMIIAVVMGIQEALERYLVVTLVSLSVGIGIVLFLWVNWIITKRMQGNQIPEKRKRVSRHEPF